MEDGRTDAFPGGGGGRLLLLIARSVVEKGSGGLTAAVGAAAVPAAAAESVLAAVVAAAAPVPAAAAAAPPPWLADMTAVWVSHAARAGLLFLEFFTNLPLSYRPPCFFSSVRTQTHSRMKLVWTLA